MTTNRDARIELSKSSFPPTRIDCGDELKEIGKSIDADALDSDDDENDDDEEEDYSVMNVDLFTAST